MEYGTPSTEDDVDMDPVIWQCSQAVELKRIFANAPVAAPAAPPPVVPETSNKARNGLKRKRWQDQDTPASSSAETLGLIQQLSRTLGSCRPNNPARRNTRIASAGALMLGPSVGTSKQMPPPRKPARSEWDSESCDEAHTPLSDAASFNWSSSRLGSTSTSVDASARSSDSNSTVIPCTPPTRPVQPPRPATEPTTTISALIARAESPEPPPPPTKPVLSIRTVPTRVDTSAFSSRSNTSESTSTVSTTGSIISTTAPGPISPVTPVAPRAETPIIDISPTPSPEPRVKSKPLPKADTPPPPKSPSPPPPSPPKSKAKPRPVQSSSRATTEPATVPSRPSLPSQQARSEPAPSQQFRPPTQQPFRPPTQQPFRPPTQQANRAFPSSQTRLGLGAIGNGYANATRPFKVPNKGGSTKSTVVALPRRGLASGSGVGGAKAVAGVTKPDDPAPSKGKEKAKPPPSPSKAGKPKPKSTSRNPSPRKENLEVGKAKTKKDSAKSRSGSSRRDPPSDDSYLASDGSFDAAAVDADMARWDAWDD